MDALVTFAPAAGIPRPVEVAGTVVLEAAAPVVWFTFPGLWHDIGRFHLPDGRFTGFYANVLTPVRLDDDDWHTTDLFLDVFLTPAGDVHILDAEELAGAEDRGWVAADVARRARAEAAAIARAARAGEWPPAVVHHWTLERARQAAAGTCARIPVYRGDPGRASQGGR